MNRISCFRWAGLSLFVSFSAAAATVSNCDEASLRAAIASDSVVIFNCDATIALSNTIVVSTDLILDATGHAVVLDGRSSVRIFDVTSGARLHLINLTLSNGRATGTTGGAGQSGGPGHGGAVRVQSATVTALNCRFSSNRAVGGDGGPASDIVLPGIGGPGEGGGIFCAPGQVRLTNCVFAGNAAIGGNGGAAPPGVMQFGGPAGIAQGGAICAGGSQISLIDCDFSGNQASQGAEGAGIWSGGTVGSWGGGCFFESGTLVASNCSWQANSADYAGGGFHNSGTAVLDRCRFNRNSTHRGSPSQGGAIYSRGTLTVRGSLFESNSATGKNGFILRGGVFNAGDAEGGAVCITAGAAGITNSAFARNEARGGNAAFGLMPGPPTPGSGSGGGLFNRASASVLNTTFGFNSATAGILDLFPTPNSRAGRGGAIAHEGNLLTLRFSTIASNHVTDLFTNSTGGGCYNSGSPVQLQSSIFSGNTALILPNNTSGSFVDLGSNLSSDFTPPLSAPGSANSINSRLTPLANYGGNTPVFALLADSPALDAAVNPPATDQRGVLRPQRARADIGAFEQTFLTIQRISAAQVQLAYQGAPGSLYTLQATLNLTDWLDLETRAAGFNGAIIFSNLNASNPSCRFFRVRY